MLGPAEGEAALLRQAPQERTWGLLSVMGGDCGPRKGICAGSKADTWAAFQGDALVLPGARHPARSLPAPAHLSVYCWATYPQLPRKRRQWCCHTDPGNPASLQPSTANPEAPTEHSPAPGSRGEGQAGAVQKEPLHWGPSNQAHGWGKTEAQEWGTPPQKPDTHTYRSRGKGALTGPEQPGRKKADPSL